MNPPTIRRAVPEDASTLAELAARTFRETFGADNTAQDLQDHLLASYGLAQQMAEIVDPDVITLLACRDDEAIGFAQVRRKTAPACVVQEHPVELHRFYLARFAHGSGAAGPLMHEARAAARTLGGRHLWLGVWEHNPRAVAFYIKSGFVHVGSHAFMVGTDRQTDWVFVSALSRQTTDTA